VLAQSDKMSDFEENFIIALDVISMSNSSVYAGGYEDCYDQLEENGKMNMLQWTTAMLGATLFVLFSKVRKKHSRMYNAFIR
jgi:hypothetical protein